MSEVSEAQYRSINEASTALVTAARNDYTGAIKQYLLDRGLQIVNDLRAKANLPAITGFIPAIPGDSKACLLALALRVANPAADKVSIGSWDSVESSIQAAKDNASFGPDYSKIAASGPDRVILNALIDGFDDHLFPGLECPLGQHEALAQIEPKPVVQPYVVQ